MKLCRFELKSEPGIVRSGMVFGGKVYETDGATAVGVHEAETVRPLSPVPQAPSLRIFRSDLQPIPHSETEEPNFYYSNPSCIVGQSQIINWPNFAHNLVVRPYVAAVIVTPGYHVELEDADDMILGLTMLCMLSVGPAEEREKRLGGGFGRSSDVGATLGPVLTTPDELDDYLVDQEYGRRYRLSAVSRVNGVERDRDNTEHLPWTFAEAITYAAQSCTVREGDVFALGPATGALEPVTLEPGDEFQVSIENLGTLTLRLAEEI